LKPAALALTFQTHPSPPPTHLAQRRQQSRSSSSGKVTSEKGPGRFLKALGAFPRRLVSNGSKGSELASFSKSLDK
jgi:hypothetical protein